MDAARHHAHPVVCYSTEAIDFFVADGLTHVGAQLDDGEFLEIVTMIVDEMLAALDRGEITDAKTVAALLLYRAAAARIAMIARRLLDPAAACRASAIAMRWSRRRASRGVAGWVRNRRDGTVEALVQGDAAAVESVIAWCRRGPLGSPASTAIDIDEAPPRAGARLQSARRPA